MTASTSTTRDFCSWDRRKPHLFRRVFERWHIDCFRPLQAEAFEAVFRGRDLLAVMPTGSGKSLCYQAPAMFNQGVTIVVSPLIALMRDQVASLNARDIPAVRLDSNLRFDEMEQAVERVMHGDVRLLYVAPERIFSPEFVTLMQRLHGANTLDGFTIDEAHCITQWGHDFRPAYAALGKLREMFRGVPIHAFTATATPRVRDEIATQLGLIEPVRLVGDFDRPNLYLCVAQRTNLVRQTVEWCVTHRGQAGIVYCPTRHGAVRMAADLRDHKLQAGAYHAGMDPSERDRVQDWFMETSADAAQRIVCATIAFGMGIDRPDIRWIIHTMMPSSMETYHQEIGRAGRDGAPAECVIFHANDDYGYWMARFADQHGRTEIMDHKDELLCEMDDFCVRPGCRHGMLRHYFDTGEVLLNPTYGVARDSCTACDFCKLQSG